MTEITLEDYYEKLLDHQNKNPVSGQRPQPAGINTLWIPEFSGNRTATLNLNHQISGFDNNGRLWGENGNCGTPYVIVQVPLLFTEAMIIPLAEKLAKKLNKKYPTGSIIRALKAERISEIEEIIMASYNFV